MTPILGIIASSISGNLDAGDFESIASLSGTGSSGTITFTSIPSTYTHLQIRASYQCSTTDNPYMRVGGSSIDTGGNYSWHHLYGDGSSALNNGNSGQTFTYFGYSQNSTNPNAGIIDILDYASVNKNKTFRILAGQDNNGGGEVALWSGSWQNSSTAIASISLITSGNFSTASRFALYGIRSA
jgi:hypothetical protein